MNEIERHDYRSKNASNGVILFSVNVIGFEFQLMGFTCDFRSFCPKIGSNDRRLYTQKFRGFTEKRKTSFYFLLQKLVH